METSLPLSIDLYHNDVKVWKSNISLINHEITFIENLTNSYIFEPRTPNLFEKLEHFKAHIRTIKNRLDTLVQSLTKHDAELSGMLECDTVSCDVFFETKHLSIKEDYRDFIDTYNEVKTEIFNYCGTILKSNKCQDNK